MKHRRTLALFAAIAACALAPSTASAWAPEESATVHPGVQTVTEGSGQCTSNFVFTSGSDVYLGQAAHCAGTGAGHRDRRLLTPRSLPLGTHVEIDGASRPGTLAYSSWLTMQGNERERRRTPAPTTTSRWSRSTRPTWARSTPPCPASAGRRAARPRWPTPADVYSYGNSSLRGGVTTLSPKQGKVRPAPTGGGWSHTVYTVSPGHPR